MALIFHRAVRIDAAAHHTPAQLADKSRRPVTRLTVEARVQSGIFFRRQNWQNTGEMTRGTGAAQIVTTIVGHDLGRRVG